MTNAHLCCTGENEGRTGERTSGIEGKLNILQRSLGVQSYYCKSHMAFILVFEVMVYSKIGPHCIADQPNSEHDDTIRSMCLHFPCP